MLFLGRNDTPGNYNKFINPKTDDMFNPNRRLLFVALLLCCFTTSLLSGSILYVDADATGTNNGNTWKNAFTSLQDALDEARQTAAVQEIWIADGIYYPTTDGDPAISFELVDGIQIYGGFDGTEKRRNERNPELNVTILSGNLGDPASVLDNSYHVVRSTNIIDPVTTLDGVTIADGHANALGDDELGGGLLNRVTSLSVTSHFVIRNCRFENNYAKKGGGLATISTMATDSLMVDQTVFINNSAMHGGGVYNYKGMNAQTYITYVNCRFESNSATGIGGAARNFGESGQTASPPRWNVGFISCVFYNNSAGPNGGGGLHTCDSGPSKLLTVLRNSTFANNTNYDVVIDFGAILRIQNTILNSDDAFKDNRFTMPTGDLSAKTSFIRNDNNNSDFRGDNYWPVIADPDFIDLDNGDVRLTACSPLLEKGTNYGFSPPADEDIDGHQRIIGVVDLGAFEYNGDPVGLPIPFIASEQVVATEEIVTPDGWTHYYSCVDRRLILSVFKAGINIGQVGAGLDVEIGTTANYGTIARNLNTATYAGSLTDWLVGNRFWKINRTLPPGQCLTIRFYFEQQDLDDINAYLIAAGESPITFNDLNFYTVDSSDPFDENVPVSGFTQFTENGNVPGTSSFTIGTDQGGKMYAEFCATDLTGGIGYEPANPLAPLPVELTFFSAVREDKRVRLDWQTASETNNDYFIVERSSDARNFRAVEVIQSASFGHSTESIDYMTYDPSPNRGENYYRLRQVDFDGTESVSDIRLVRFTNQSGRVQLFPNPTADLINIELPEDVQGEVELLIYDDLRRIVWQQDRVDTNAGILRKDISDFAPGLYTLRIKGKRYRTYQTFIKVNP